MSLEDLSSLTQSDESDGEAERLWSDGEYDAGGEARYFDLVLLHGELTNFENIYCNNDIIDMEDVSEQAAGLFFDTVSLVAEMADQFNSYFQAMSSISSSSTGEPEQTASTENADVSSSCSSSASDSGFSDVQETDGEDIN